MTIEEAPHLYTMNKLGWFGAIYLVVYKNSSNKVQPPKESSQGFNSRPQSSPNSQKSKPKTRESTRKQSMLNTHKMAPFKYDLKEILSKTQIDEAKASAMLASLIAKASRVSTREAKDFVRTYVDAGDLTKDEFDKIARLMDKYSKFR